MTAARRRERERRERRFSILDAAERVFHRRGFDHATMDDVAAEAELSKGTLYLYFKNKDDLFTALSCRVAESMVSRFEALAASEPTGLAAIAAMLSAYAAFILANPQHFRMKVGRMASGQLGDPDVPSCAGHRAQIDRIVGAFTTAIQRGKQDRSLRADIDPVQISSQLWGGLIGTLLVQINSDEFSRRCPRPVDFTKFIDGYIDLICNGLRPPAAGHAMESRS